MPDTCLGFGRQTACGIVYGVNGLGRNPRDIRTGAAIRVTSSVADVTCAACDTAFTAYARARGLQD